MSLQKYGVMKSLSTYLPIVSAGLQLQVYEDRLLPFDGVGDQRNIRAQARALDGKTILQSVNNIQCNNILIPTVRDLQSTAR